MSYCRWSSDDWQCDVYVYEDASGGWTCHVANRRHVFDDTYPGEFGFPRLVQGSPGYHLAWQGWFANHSACHRWMDKHMDDESRWLDLSQVSPKYAGTHHNLGSPGDMALLLVAMKADGLLVPQYAIDALVEEQRELDSCPTTHLEAKT